MRKLPILVAVAVAVLVAPLTTVPTQATWGGANGMITYVGGVGGFSPDYQIYVINPDSTGRHRLTDAGGNGIFRPSWSPDGNRLLAWEQENFGGAGTTVALNADGTGRTPLSSEAIKASWSRDGSKIVYVAATGTFEQVVTMATNGTQRTQVTNIPTYKWIARWSPTDDRIAFGSSHNSFSPDPDDAWGGISVVTGSDRVKVVDVNGYVDQLDWSPDGTRIAFIAQPCSLVPPHPSLNCDGVFGTPGYTPNIHVVSVATGAVTALTHDTKWWTSVAWSPDGTRLAATVNEGAGGDPAVMALPAGGGAPTTVIEPGTRDHCTDFGCSQVPESVSSVDWQPCVSGTAACLAVTSADVSTQLSGPSTTAPLAHLAYTSQISNGGPDTAPGATLSLEWSGATFVSVDTQLTCTLATSTLVCFAASLGSGVDRQLMLHLRAPAAPGTVHVTANADSTAADAVPENDVTSADTIVTVQPVPPPPPPPVPPLPPPLPVPTSTLLPTPAPPSTASPLAPDRMKAPTVVARGTRAIVKWDAAVSNGNPVTRYLIDISKGKDKTTGPSVRKVVLKNLKPGRYRIRIAAQNTIGTSPHSTWATVRIR